MKTITYFLLAILVGISTQLFAQNSRLFYQTNLNNNHHSYFTVGERNGTPYFFAIKETDGIHAKLAYGPIDVSNLSPTYTYLTLPIQQEGTVFINGINTVGNKLDLLVQYRANGYSKFVFYEIDLQSNTIISTTSTQQVFHNGYFRARTVNQKLVMYAINVNDQQLIRFEKEIDNPYTTTVVPTTESLNPSSALQKITELKIIDNEELFILSKLSSGVTIIKRNFSGDYSSTSLTFNAITGWDLIPYTNNRLLVTCSSKYFVLNNDLSIDNEQVLDLSPYGSPITVNRTTNILDNQIHIYTGNNKILKMNLNFDIIEEVKLERMITVFDFFYHNNDYWTIGQTQDGEDDQNNMLKSLMIMRNADVTNFDEYRRKMNWNDFHLNIDNYNNLFTPSYENTNAMSFLLNDTLRSLLHASFDALIGKDENDNLVGTFQNYSNSSSQLPGPIFTSVADSNLQRDKYNRSYYVTAQMISDHVGHVLTYGNPNYGMPNGIRYWPGNGNTTNGEAQKLADFVDQNNNGIYEPHLGDFPKIYGDKCLLSIFHQKASDDMNNDLEIHRYLFSYDCDTSEVLQKTLFCNIKYINRGSDIKDVYVGTYLDYNIGYSADDYVGTNVELGLTYNYNGDPFDESNGSQIGFQDSIPAFGQVILSGVKLENDNQDNAIGVEFGESLYGIGFGDGIIDNEFYTLESSRHMTNVTTYPYYDPSLPLQHYFALQGLYINGTPVNFNGITTRYELFGQSDPNFYATGGIAHSNNYTETSMNNSPGDRRMIGGSGPGYLQAGDTLNYLTAYVLSFGNRFDPKGPSVGQLFTDVQKIKDFFTGNELGCGKTFDLSNESLSIKKVEQLDFTVHPNPFTNELFVSHDFKGDVQLTVRNLNGQEVFRQASVANQEQINMELNSGVYFMELNTSKGTIVKKLVRR